MKVKLLEELMRVMARQSGQDRRAHSNEAQMRLLGQKEATGQDAAPVLFSRVDAKRIKDKGSTYSEHFNDSFWYRATSFLWGKPVQAIRDFNKTGRFGTERARYRSCRSDSRSIPTTSIS